MKKIYLLSSVLFFAGVSSGFGQQTMFKAQTLAKNKIVNVSSSTNTTTSGNSSRAVLWSDDFTTPANWVIANEAGNSDNWVIGTNGPAGGFAIPDITTTGNFALFDSDVLCSGNQIANLTTKNSIDL